MKSKMWKGAVGGCMCFVLLIGVIAVSLHAQTPYDEYRGTTIVVNFPSHVHYEAAMTLIPEFEKETGIKVEVDMLQYMRMHDKQVLEMSKPVGDYDVISFVCMWKTEYVAPGLLTPLAPFFTIAKLADPQYDQFDLVPAYVAVTGMVGGPKGYLPGPGAATYAIPFGAETSLLAYRKDLFDKYGLTPPDTYDEVRKYSRFFAEEVPGIYGLTMRGAAGHQATAAWLFNGDPFGVKVFDENWEPIVNNQAAIDTLYFMKDTVKYGPPGIPAFGFDAMANALLEGIAAMYIDSVAIAGMVRSPEKSKVVGKIAYALHPRQKQRASETGGFGLGIPANARNKEAAFLFIQWITSKEADKKLVLAGGAPFRMSTVNDPQMQKKFPEYKVLAEQLKYADPDWRPIIPEWGEINVQLMGVAVSQVLTGEKSPEEAMNAVVGPIRKIMQKAGYYSWQRK